MEFTVYYKDKDVVICEKPVGVLSEGDGMPVLLGKELALTGENRDLFPVHRLDRAVGGLMIFARTKKAAAQLSSDFAENRVTKEYLAVVSGIPPQSSGVLQDLLFKDSRQNKTYPVKRMRKGVKEAELSYETLKSAATPDGPVSLVKIRLKTGRSHQIRVQFSSRKMPLLGDGKYGSRIKGDIALWSHSLTFWHPTTKEALTFSAPMPEKYPWTLF